MKYLLTLFLFLNIIVCSQVDKNGNPIFYSIPISEDTLGNFLLSSNYYTISNNINNPESSVFVNENPSTEEIIEFVRTKPSYFFLVHQNQDVSTMIMILPRIDGKKSKYSYLIMNPNNNQQIELPCEISGDVTEIRAAELLKEYEKDSKELHIGPKSFILFGNVAYSTQSFDEVKNDLISLVTKYKLYEKDVDLEEID
jgi:hypothetical protein